MKLGTCIEILILLLSDLRKAQQGAVAIIFAFFLTFVMIPVLALSIDMGGGYLMSSEMQNAATAASIASAIEDGDTAEAEQYFAANLPVGQHSISYDFASDVAVIKTGTKVSVVPTKFERPGFFSPAMQPVGVAVIKASALSVASLGAGEVVPTNFAVILDRSGSMGPPPFPQTTSPMPNGGIVMKALAAAQSFDIIMRKVEAAQNAQDNYDVAVTSFSTSAEPQFAFDYTHDFKQATDDVYNIMNDPFGATCGACGLQAMSKLMPNAPGNDRKMTVIMMTDGSQNHPHTCPATPQPPGYQIPPSLPANIPVFSNPPNACEKLAFIAAAAECELIKLNNPKAEIWTIAFGADSRSSNNIKLLDFCASAPEKSLYAASGAELSKIFNQIISQTLKARLTK